MMYQQMQNIYCNDYTNGVDKPLNLGNTALTKIAGNLNVGGKTTLKDCIVLN